MTDDFAKRISEEDGEKILSFAEQSVAVSVYFDVVERKRANVSLWIDVGDHRNFVFLREMHEYLKKIESHCTHSLM